MFAEIKESADYIFNLTGFKAETGIVLGTGLGGLVKEIVVEHEISYEDIPHFPLSTVESHTGKLILGSLEGVKVVVMQGRFHYYEGYSLQQIVFPIRVMKLLGINNLFISNAAGGINPGLLRGDLVIIEDQINHFPGNPLVGKNIDELGFRFPDMSAPFDKEFVEQAMNITTKNGIQAKKGVYVGLPGPMLETPAEYKYLGIIGADVVGMSTVPEVIAARHMGLRTFACSIVTDVCYGEIKKVDIQDIIKTAMAAEPSLSLLFRELIKINNK
ncbi:MAG: purine-nucleoside phosphorylase [Saprospiraceae bacterium]|jgi:purine-nucleoside phosphorylase